jgi:hypothetical protein
VAKYEDNTPRHKKVMTQVQFCGRERQRQRRRDYSNNTSTFFQKKVELKNQYISAQSFINEIKRNEIYLAYNS